MNLSDLKIDLNNKCPETYFTEKLFDKDERIFGRRSFGDLFNYYRPKGVSEKLLLKALVESGFSSYRCPDISDFVFFKWHRGYKFFSHALTASGHSAPVNQKYTFKYLNKLYDSRFKK
jgi:hypothetical protein